MNQYIYYNFDEIDREMVLNLSTLNEVSPVEQTSSKGGEIQWRCSDKYIVTYYFYFPINRNKMYYGYFPQKWAFQECP